MPTNINQLELFTKNSIISGRIDEEMEKLNQRKIVLKKLRANKDQLNFGIKEVLIQLIDSGEKDIIDLISSDLSNRAIEIYGTLINNQCSFESSFQDESLLCKITRKDYFVNKSGEIIITPCNLDGIDYLKKYNAWGYIAVSDTRKPNFISFYLTAPHSEIRFIGKIKFITPKITSLDEIKEKYGIDSKDIGEYVIGKKMIILEENSFVELSDPIPTGERIKGLRGLIYSNVANFCLANNLDDLY